MIVSRLINTITPEARCNDLNKGPSPPEPMENATHSDNNIKMSRETYEQLSASHASPAPYSTKPLSPPRSKRFKRPDLPQTSQTTITPNTTSSTLTDMSNTPEYQAAITTRDRIEDFLAHLPNSQDPSDPCLGRDPACNEDETPNYYQSPNGSCNSHVYLRFRQMLREEPEASFGRHRAFLDLRFGEGGENPQFTVGVDDAEHANRIHMHMHWLRTKWLGDVPLRYHIMEYDE